MLLTSIHQKSRDLWIEAQRQHERHVSLITQAVDLVERSERLRQQAWFIVVNIHNRLDASRH
jgi:hypothetical protein